MQLIQLHQIRKVYSSGLEPVAALDRINLTVDSGEFLAITGRSGSGKSTLMNLIGCLDQPTDGTYLLHGRPVYQQEEAERTALRNQTIGFIFQGFHLIPTLTAFENVELPLLYRGMPKHERKLLASKALQRVFLQERKKHLPHQLSGGQQQRVAIARAIAAKPPLILADEPTGNLDGHAGSEVMHMLMELNEEGKTLIVITHDPAIAALAHRSVTIQDGKIVQEQHLRPKTHTHSAPSSHPRTENLA